LLFAFTAYAAGGANNSSSSLAGDDAAAAERRLLAAAPKKNRFGFKKGDNDAPQEIVFYNSAGAPLELKDNATAVVPLGEG